MKANFTLRKMPLRLVNWMIILACMRSHALFMGEEFVAIVIICVNVMLQGASVPVMPVTKSKEQLV